MKAAPIVFTDLDGTLLDHADYGYDAAQPALARLRELDIPLVLCTSKTAAEILALRGNPDFENCAAIVENGAGLLRPDAREPEPTPTHARLLELVGGLPASLRESFSGFSDWSVETLAERTGLDPESARRAARRDYSEPGLWLGSENARRDFVAALGKLGINAQRGGRFLTLGFGADKADRMQELVAEYEARMKAPVVAIALGDAPNDIEMLESADFGIVVPNPAHAGIPPLAGESRGHIMRAVSSGAAGWNQSLLDLLDELGSPARGTNNG